MGKPHTQNPLHVSPHPYYTEKREINTVNTLTISTKLSPAENA
jgi:hypothetical protein